MFKIDGATGVVVGFNPKTALYKVQIDGMSEVTCRRMRGFGTNVFERGDRVALMKFPGLQWTVMGSPDTPEGPPDEPARDDDVERALENPAGIQETVEDTDPTYAANTQPKEGPQAEVDQQIEAGDSMVTRGNQSRLGMRGSGSIIAQTTHFCFTFWDNLKSAIVERCRTFLRTAIGWIFRLDIDPIDSSRQTLRMSFAGQSPREAVLERVDVSLTAGHIPEGDDRRPGTRTGRGRQGQASAQFGAGMRMFLSPGLLLDSDAENGELRLTYLTETGGIRNQIRFSAEEFTIERRDATGLSTLALVSIVDEGVVVKGGEIVAAPQTSLRVLAAAQFEAVTGLAFPSGLPGAISFDAASSIVDCAAVTIGGVPVLSETFALNTYNAHIHASEGAPPEPLYQGL